MFHLISRTWASTKAVLLVSGLASAVLATPQLSVDNADVNMGILVEGKQKVIEHVYVVKNTGDAALHIKQVRPGCGCTVVGFDSLIQAGKEGKIKATLNVENIRSGPFKKSITVTSDAANSASMILYLGGTMKAIIDVQPMMINIKAGASKDSNQVIVIKTLKSDLKISDVLLKTPSQGEGGQWQAALPVYFDYSLTRKEKPDSTGQFEYALKLGIKSKDVSTRSGELEVTTNHPEKKSIVLRTYIMQ